MAKLPEIQVFYNAETGEEFEAYTKQAAAQEMSRVLGYKVDQYDVLTEDEWFVLTNKHAAFGCQSQPAA